MTVNEMIDRVLQGESPYCVLEDNSNTVPAWKPGESVPDGYRVVFGRLVKDTGHNIHPNHVQSTKAWSATANAKSSMDHGEAYRAHLDAAQTHRKSAQAYYSGSKERKQHMAAASAHARAANKHYAEYEKHRDNT